MNIKSFETIWQSGKILREAFAEYKEALNDVYERSAEILRSPSYTPQEFTVGMDKIPAEFFSIRRNIFSTLFQSMYHLLDVKKPQRLLYGKMNHLFRTWVTSADNLLDNEDKIVIPIRIPGRSRVMRQVISIMAADRIMKQLLDEACLNGVLTLGEARILADDSLRILLPSAAEEASEEGGVNQRPDPEYVLYTIHRLKTGMLFHVPFLGPEKVEMGINPQKITVCKDALDKFGLGCQLLDDIRDMAKDYLQRRHNYVLSKIYFEERGACIQRLKEMEKDTDFDAKIHPHFPDVVRPAALRAADFLEQGLTSLKDIGLDINDFIVNTMVSSMFNVLDIGDLI